MSSYIDLYHFTCQENLSDILVDGFLEPSDSLLSQKRENAGPGVVWLTSSPAPPNPTSEDAAYRMDLAGSQFDKTAIRFTVRIHKNRAQLWRKWANAHGIDREWLNTIARGSSGSGSWWVVQDRIHRESWTEIRDMRTDQVYLIAGGKGFEYQKPLGYDFEPHYTQADIEKAYRRTLYEMGETFDLPDDWTERRD